MGRLLKAFVFKIRKDITFRITLIIGAAIAVFMAVLYFALDRITSASDIPDSKFLTGPNMLINSMSPIQNFGIAIPVNLISFTCLEFTQGTIRNKIIAGNSKFKIYASLFVSGLIFAFSLLFVYLGVCTALGSIFGGFNLEKPTIAGTAAGYASVGFILKMLLICVVTYISVVSFAIFIATAMRSIGPSIPIVMVTLMFAGLFVTIVSSMKEFYNMSTLLQVLKFVDPLYGLVGGPELNKDTLKIFIANDTLIASVINNLAFAAIFFAAGSLLFKKRDVK